MNIKILTLLTILFAMFLIPSQVYSEISEAEIKEAVKNLGHNDWDIREEASEVLFKAGKKAIPFLRKAAESKDREVQNRALKILKKYESGVSVNTNKEIKELYDKYFNSVGGKRIEIYKELCSKGISASETIIGIYNQESDLEIKRELDKILLNSLGVILPAFLIKKDYKSAEKILNAAFENIDHTGLRYYAVYNYLKGNLQSEIDKLKIKFQVDKGPNTTLPLIYFYRMQNDLENAIKVAEQAKQDNLLLLLFFESYNYEKILQNKSKVKYMPFMPYDTPSFICNFYKLTGDNENFNRLIENMLNLHIRWNRENNLWIPGETLLLNDEFDKGIEILEKVNDTYRAFNIKSLRSDFASIENDINKHYDTLDFNLARSIAEFLYLNGQTEKANALYDKWADSSTDVLDDFIMLIRSEANCNNKPAIYKHMALYHRRKLENKDLAVLFNNVIGIDVNTAMVLWYYVDSKLKDEPYEKKISTLINMFIRASDKDLDKLLDDNINFEWPEKFSKDIIANSIGKAYLKRGKIEKAEEYFDRALKISENSYVILASADFYFDHQKWEKASACYQKLAENNKQDITSTYLWGYCQKKLGNEDKGKELILLSRLIPLANGTVRSQLAEELHKRGLIDEALAEYDLIINSSVIFPWTGRDFRVDLGEYVPTFNAIKARSIICREKDMFTESSKAVERTRQLCLGGNFYFSDPKRYLDTAYKVHSDLAIHYARKKEFEKAISEAMISYKAMPFNPSCALNVISELNKNNENDKSKTLANHVINNLNQALEKYPNNSNHHTSIAQIYAIQGNEAKAIEHINKALILRPDSTTQNCLAAKVYHFLGKKEKAMELINKCLSDSPNNNEYELLFEKIKSQK